MRLLPPTCVLLLALSLACQRKSAPADDSAEATPAGPAIAAGGEPLVFPPPASYRPRRALPESLSGADPSRPPEIESPELDGDGHFEFAGSTVRIEFSEKVRVRAGSRRPALSLVPPVAGKLRWTSPWILTFEAKEPFDPDRNYTITLGDIEDEQGLALPPWQASFRADPEIWMAGKLLAYIPTPAQPRVVAVRPTTGTQVGSFPTFRVLFDQAIELDAAAELVSLRDGDAKLEVGHSIRHPSSNNFEGVKIDREQVIEVEPRSLVSPGTALTLVARDHGAKPEDAEQIAVEVAQPLAFTGIECGYDVDRCDFDADAARLKIRGRNFTMTFNNTIATRSKAVTRSLTIDPPVRNLSAWVDRWSADGRISISGAFEPSTRYTVKTGPLRDAYGGSWARPIVLELDTDPLPASVSMPEGIQYLDAERSGRFTVTTRNVTTAELRLWVVEDSEPAWSKAEEFVRNHVAAAEPPEITIPVRPQGDRDQEVQTEIDLLKALAPSRSYMAVLALQEPAHGASEPKYTRWADPSPHALLTVNDAHALAIHARSTPEETIVLVTRLSDGQPVANAAIDLDGLPLGGILTDAHGGVRLALSEAEAARHLLTVRDGKRRASLALGRNRTDAGDLVPELQIGAASPEPIRGFVFSDRGAYRPGATILWKSVLRMAHEGDLRPIVTMPVRMRVVSPSGRDLASTVSITDELGAVSGAFATEVGAEVGRYRILVESPFDAAMLAQTVVQVAEFEPPRFTVDVEARAERDTVIAQVSGRYLFGAAMDEADVAWTLRRTEAAFGNGPLVARGLRFRPLRDEYDSYDEYAAEDAYDPTGEGSRGSTWMRNGTAKLGADGALELRNAIELVRTSGPQRFTLEAEVTDSSHRAIAARDSVVLHPTERYAGIAVTDRWPGVGEPIGFELGVIDQRGEAVTGATLGATLEHISWKRTRRRGPGGSVRVDWHEQRRKVGHCSATSAAAPVSCPLATGRSGEYIVTAAVDGRSGGQIRLWSWGEGEATARGPSTGHRLDLLADKRAFAAGETATVAAHNPFARATAIFTVEAGEVIETTTREVAGGPVKWPVSIQGKFAPWVHATVTLLPRDAEGDAVADWRFGAIRLPVDLAQSRLHVAVASDQPTYEPGSKARVTIDVTRAGRPVENVDVALAVVDEGILRLTNFHAPDPVSYLRPGVGLSFALVDTRKAFAQMLERSHTGGGGMSDGSQSLVEARKDFVETALWRPQLRSDAQGQVEVVFDVPDNLTRFRMMAVAVDADGRGGTHEAHFEVRKPLMVIPVVPRFAKVGETFEVAAMVHSGLAEATVASVRLGELEQSVELAPGGRARATFAFTPTQAGDEALRFSARSGDLSDIVEVRLPVQTPGIDESPRLSGAFARAQDILLEVPSGLFTDPGRDRVVTVTLGQRAWPELGKQLEYLIGYPHGCVEQTTSSTLPLLAAREILPRIGLTRYSREDIDARVRAGIERLATMKTDSGGLAYWPGGTEPDLYGTAYAMRAVALAEADNVAIVPGLRAGMHEYLEGQLRAELGRSRAALEVRSAVALALAESGGLPESASDALIDGLDAQGVFGLANLALAISSLPDRAPDVARLLDALESHYDPRGRLTEADVEDFDYYGSATRTRAQTLLALSRLRPASRLIPTLVDELVGSTQSYTTQATAFGLLALREQVLKQADPSEAGQLRVFLEGRELLPDVMSTLTLGVGSRRYEIPIDAVEGRHVLLHLENSADAATSYLVESRWRRPLGAAATRVATTSAYGPEMYRIYTDAKGAAIDPAAIKPGQVVRVALMARLPVESVARSRMGFVALTDRIPAGFEPIVPELWTVSRSPDIERTHPLYDELRWGRADASHVELRDDRVHLYFDRVWGEFVAGTYLMRATTVGGFIAPPALGELMYEGDSYGYSDTVRFEVAP